MSGRMLGVRAERRWGRPMESHRNVLSWSDAHDSCFSGWLWLQVKRGRPRDKSRIRETRWEMMGVLQRERGRWSRFYFEGRAGRAC